MSTIAVNMLFLMQRKKHGGGGVIPRLSGQIEDETQLLGSLTIEPPLALSGGVRGSTTLNGDLTEIPRPELSGAINGRTNVVAAFSPAIHLSGKVDGSSSISGELRQSIGLQGNTEGRSILAGGLSVVFPSKLAGLINGGSDVYANVETSVEATPGDQVIDGLPPQPPNYEAAIRQLVGELDALGVWAKLDTFLMFTAADEASALTDWKRPDAVVTKVGTVVFTPDLGFTVGDEPAAGYDAVETGFIPNVDGAQYTANASHEACFIESETNSIDRVYFGYDASIDQAYGMFYVSRGAFRIRGSSTAYSTTGGDVLPSYLASTVHSETSGRGHVDGEHFPITLGVKGGTRPESVLRAGGINPAADTYRATYRTIHAGGALTDSQIDNARAALLNFYAAIAA